MNCDNCGLIVDFTELGEDGFGNRIYECSECGAVCYEDGTLVDNEEEVKVK